MLRSAVTLDGKKIYYELCCSGDDDEVDINFYSTPYPVPKYHLSERTVKSEDLSNELDAIGDYCIREYIDESDWTVMTLEDFFKEEESADYYVYDSDSDFEYPSSKISLNNDDKDKYHYDIFDLDCFVNQRYGVMIINVLTGYGDLLFESLRKESLRKFFNEKREKNG